MEKNFLQGRNIKWNIKQNFIPLSTILFDVFAFFFCNWLALNRSRSSTKSIRIGRRQRARLEPEMDDFKMCESCCNLQKFSMPRSRYWCSDKISYFPRHFLRVREKVHEGFEVNRDSKTCMGESLISFLIRSKQYQHSSFAFIKSIQIGN